MNYLPHYRELTKPFQDLVEKVRAMCAEALEPVREIEAIQRRMLEPIRGVAEAIRTANAELGKAFLSTPDLNAIIRDFDQRRISDQTLDELGWHDSDDDDEPPATRPIGFRLGP